MDILLNIFLYGYLPFLALWWVNGIYERVCAILGIGSRDTKDSDGMLSLYMGLIVGIIPIFNIWMTYGVFIEIPIKDYLRGRKRHER